MKKILFITLLFMTITLYSEEKQMSSSITAGTEYLEDFYINFGYSIQKPLENNTELDFKVALNIRTETDESDDSVTPMFNIPFKAGINFLFPLNDKFTFLVGTGISPMLRLSGNDKAFLIGPNAKAGIRVKVHPSMSVFAEACESMLIGGDDWLYFSTDIVIGVNFFI